MFKINAKHVMSILSFWVAICLNSCTPANPQIAISDVSVSQEPIVGQIVNLHVEITSKYDEPEVTFTVDFLEQYNNRIHHVSGDTQWVGPMAANEKKTFDLSFCVWEEGTWPIEIYARRTAPGDKYYDSKRVHMESWIDSGKFISFAEFPANQTTPTPRPFPVSPECSGQK